MIYNIIKGLNLMLKLSKVDFYDAFENAKCQINLIIVLRTVIT
jgi:hypothetical protein